MLKDQVAIISGARSGIGKAIALRFANEGADVVIVDKRDDEDTQRSASMIEELGRKVLVCKADVGNVSAFREVVEKTLEKFNRIDILVNNAGVFIPTPLLEMTEEVWYETLDTNLKAALFCTQAVAQYWVKEERGGKVVNIGSVHATRSWPNNTAYATSRAGLRGLTMLMAQELAPHKINVNMVSPGLIATRIPREWWQTSEFRERALNEIALKRMGEPKEVAGLVFFLVSEEGNYVTGSEYIMDGGLLLYSYSI
jgi:NAD(P)-dependent dehydrogenase (short-subunit alcohol dehydrogenase family)